MAIGSPRADGSISQGPEYVYIFQTDTGTVLTRLGPIGEIVHHIAVSRDGRYLAATLGGGEGLRVWERKGADHGNWRLIAEDRDYGDEASHGASFDSNGVLYTTAYDGKLRRYAVGYTAKPKSAS